MTREELIEAYKNVKALYRKDGYYKYWFYQAIDEAIRTLRNAKNPVKVFQRRFDEQSARQHLPVFPGSYSELQMNLSAECLEHLK